MTTNTPLVMPAQIRWETRSDLVVMTLELNYGVLLGNRLVQEYEEMMHGLTIVRDAVAAMQQKVTPPRFLPEEDAALLARAGLPFRMELVT